MKSDKHDCIDPDKVPCEKARQYLGKKGLLCGVKSKKTEKPKPKHKKSVLESFFNEWFG